MSFALHQRSSCGVDPTFGTCTQYEMMLHPAINSGVANIEFFVGAGVYTIATAGGTPSGASSHVPNQFKFNGATFNAATGQYDIALVNGPTIQDFWLQTSWSNQIAASRVRFQFKANGDYGNFIFKVYNR